MKGAQPVPTSGKYANRVETVFDALGRPVIETEIDAANKKYETTYAYDGFITTVNPPGELAGTRTRVDAYGQTLETINLGSGRTVTNTYDGRGLLVATGPASARVSMVYDDAGRLVSRTEPNSGTVTYGYDPNGNVTSQVDAENNRLAMTYDSLNRLIERSDLTTNKTLATWSYNPTSGLAEASTSYEPGGVYTQTIGGYDRWDRPTKTTWTVTPTNGQPFEYSEATPNLTPTGLAPLQSYTGLGSMPATTIDTGFGPLGTPVTAGSYVSATRFDQLGRVIGRDVNAGDISRSYQYTPRRMLQSLTAEVNTGSDTGVVQNDVYGYDTAGLITTINHTKTADGDTHRECFQHDTAGRLTKAHTTTPGGSCNTSTNADVVSLDTVGYSTGWTLNADGQMLARDHYTAANPTGEQSSFSYGPGPAQIASDGVTGFEYDDNGARIKTANIDQQASSLQLLDSATRLYDSRVDDTINAKGQPTGGPTRLKPGEVRTIDLDGIAPAGAAAVVVNAVIVDPDGAGGELALFRADRAAGASLPVVTSRGEQAYAGLAIVELSDNNQISMRAGAREMDVVLDVTGYYRPETGPVAAGRVLPINPTRIYDSRTTTDGPIKNGERRRIPTTKAAIPADAAGVIATITATNTTGPGYFTVLNPATDPGGKPPTSTLNYDLGQDRANQVAVYIDIDDNGSFTVYAGGTAIPPGGPAADVIVDVLAYVTGDNAVPSEEGLFTPFPFPLNIKAVNLGDGGITEPFRTAGLAGVPPADETLMVAGTLTLNATNAGHASIYAADTGDPKISNVNAGDGESVTAFTTTAISDDGEVVINAPAGGVVSFNVAGFYRKSIPEPSEAHDLVQPGGYEWNSEQHLAATITDQADGGTITTSYDYLADGARIAQHQPDGTTTYYLGTTEATRNPDGTWGIIRRQITHAGVTVASRTTNPTNNTDETTFLFGNHQGSITTQVTDTGDATSRWYEPYGKPRGPLPDDPATTTGFLNQHQDTTGLTYLNNRYLDPELGAFITVDPLVATTWEPYTYAATTPIMLSDPTGLEPRPIHCKQGCGDPGPDPYQSGCGGYGCATSLPPPTSGTETGEQKPLYDKEFFLFPDNHGGAEFWMDRMQNDPASYFPFTLRVETCAAGGPVDGCKPIQVGNVLFLSGGFPDLLGHVEVIDATSTSFRFFALMDHEAGRGGTITFSMREEQFDDGADVYLDVVATTQVDGPWNVEGLMPARMTKFWTHISWSTMTAAFRCEHAYVGQEQYRRC